MADARAHDHDQRPGARSPSTAGAETCASMFATATGVPGSRPVQRRRPLGRDRLLRSPSGRRVARHLLVDDVARSADRAPRSSRRDGKPSRFDQSPCSRRCSSLRVSTAGQLPHDPVGSLDQPPRRARRPRGLVEDLQRLREEPLGRDLAAVPRRATARLARAATALIRSASGWAAWCFQSFTQACGWRRRSASVAQRRAVGGVGSIVHDGEVDADPDDVRGIDAGRGEHARDRLPRTCAGSRRDPAAPSPARARHRRRAPGSRSSMTPLRRRRRRSRSRRRRRSRRGRRAPDSVPKSTPIAYRGPLMRSARSRP